MCRTTQGGACLLTPTRPVAALIRYAVLLSASRHRDAVKLYATAFLSTHPHYAIQDQLGGADSCLPDFFRDVHSLIARGVNAHLGRSENLWGPGSYRSVEVHGELSRDDQLLYVWTQPVSAGLVKHPEEWPGLMILPEDLGRELSAERPSGALFGAAPLEEPPLSATLRAEIWAESRSEEDKKRSRTARRRRQLRQERQRRANSQDLEARAHAAEGGSTLPEAVTYRVPVPPGFDSAETARVYFRRLLDARLRAIWAEREAQGLGYLGPAAILAQDPFERPLGRSANTRPGFSRNPRIACLEGKELRLALYEGLTAWRRHHAENVEILLSNRAPWRARFLKGTHLRARHLRIVRAAPRAPPPPPP